MGAINFYLKKPEAVSGKSLIYLQFKYAGKKLVYSFGQTILPESWNKAKQRVKSNRHTTTDGDHSLNDLLDALQKVLERAYKEELKMGVPTIECLKKHLDGFINQNEEPNKNTPTFFKLIDRFISGEIKRDGKAKSRGSINNYRSVKLHLEGFQKTHRYKIDFDSITLDFFYKYTDYLKTELKLATNTVAKDISIIKVFMGEAADLGYTQNNQFRNRKFSYSEIEKESVYLTEDEILQLHQFDLSNHKKLERVKDLFVFGCFVGLRFSDFTDVRPENIVEFEGDLYIKIKTKKTGEEVVVPCHPVVREIFNKYSSNANQLPKPLSNQKFNAYIKDVCHLAGLVEKGRLISEPEKELYNAVSSHTARRSFATNYYLQSFPSLDLMKITGHKTEKAFLKYIKVSKLDTAKRLGIHIQKRWPGSILRVSA